MYFFFVLQLTVEVTLSGTAQVGERIVHPLIIRDKGCRVRAKHEVARYEVGSKFLRISTVELLWRINFNTARGNRSNDRGRRLLTKSLSEEDEKIPNIKSPKAPLVLFRAW